MKTETEAVNGKEHGQAEQCSGLRKNITVIYHSADFDGIFCREIARRYFGDKADYIGWNYGDTALEFPKEGAVYVLDLSPECFWESPLRPEFLERLIWIDHHQSAIAKFPTVIRGYRINGVAACRLTWQWFQTGCHEFALNAGPDNCQLATKERFFERSVREPYAVRLAGEYDIWDKRDPDAEVFQFGLRSLDLEPHWSDLLSYSRKVSIEEIEQLIDVGHDKNLLDPDGTSRPAIIWTLLGNGKLLQQYQQGRDKSAITKLGFTVKWEGLTFLACNASMYNSHLFTSGILPEHEGLLGFNFDGERFNVSLYGVPGKPDVDLAAIATKYGGGGHKQACGFRCEKMPWQ